MIFEVNVGLPYKAICMQTPTKSRLELDDITMPINKTGHIVFGKQWTYSPYTDAHGIQKIKEVLGADFNLPGRSLRARWCQHYHLLRFNFKFDNF